MLKRHKNQRAVPSGKTFKGGWGAAAAIGTAALAGLAIYNRSRTLRTQQRHPALGRLVQVDGVNVHVIDRGQGPALVLVHGNGTSVEDWAASGLLDRLAATHRVIAIDRPGYGYTDRPRTTLWTPAAQAALIGRVLRILGVERPVVVGHSFGTLVAVALGLGRDPEVAGLVLLSGYYYPSVRVDVLVGAPPAIPLIGDVLRHTVSPVMGAATFRGVAAGLFAPAELDERFMTANRDLALRPSQIRAEAADAALMVPSAVGLAKRCTDLAMPVGIAAGDGDLLVDATDESERLHRDLPGSLFRRIAGAGHMVHYSHQNEVVELIADVVARAKAA
jgi:pimeloyl-ACP methyl ester carboxylesterase